MTAQLTAKRLRQVLSYDKDSGAFVWIAFPGTKFPGRLGRRAGNVSKTLGYESVRIDGRLYLSHRLAWLFVVGEWPAEQIDHLNGDRADNRFANLRQATNKLNAQNQRHARQSNIAGFLGVGTKRGKFRARIKVDGVEMSLGTFDAPEAAHFAYVSAKRILHEGGTL